MSKAKFHGQRALPHPRSWKIKKITVSPHLILSLLQVGDGVVVDGREIYFARDEIPDSVTAIRCGIDEDGCITLIIEDESFREVSEGARIPKLVPIYEDRA